MREPLIDLGATALDTPDSQQASPWGGLSGAVLFHQGLAVGVIVEHHPRQGSNALRAIAFDTLARSSDPDTVSVVERLGVGTVDDLVWATADSAAEPPPTQ